MNNTENAQPNVRLLSCTSILLAVLGGAFYWWAPMGMVLSLAGFIVGLIDWNAARRRSLDYRLSIVGMILCAAAFILASTIAYLGMQTVTFGGE